MKRRRTRDSGTGLAGRPAGSPAAAPGPSTPVLPVALESGVSGLAQGVLAVASLFVGGLVIVLAKGPPLDGELIGVALAGLLLVAPLPMFAGDAMDAGLVLAVRSRRLTFDGYRRVAPLAVPAAIAVVGVATYPLVVAIGGKSLFSIFVVAAAFVLFGAIPVGAWLVRRLRRSRAGG